MVLPSSGTISGNSVNVEMQRTGTTSFNINGAVDDWVKQSKGGKFPADFYGDPANPDSMSEFYDGRWIPECFIAGTQVTMSGYIEKNIEDIEIAEYVIAYNPHREIFEEKEVLMTLTTIHTGEPEDLTIKIDFDNGVQLHCTDTNPFWCPDTGKYWISYNPPKCQFDHDLSTNKMEIGDNCVTLNGTAQITNITEVTEEITTYSLRVKNWATFVANGIVAHNKCVNGDTLVYLPDMSTKQLTTMQVGEKIMSYNGTNLEEDVILEMENVSHEELFTFGFSDGTTIRATADHPFLIDDNVYGALRPSAAYGIECQPILLGNTVKVLVNGFIVDRELSTIIRTKNSVSTFAIKLEKNNCFIGNNVLCYTGITN